MFLHFVFISERGAPFTTAGFARMVERAGVEAKFAFKTHPHMLRHACGYALASKGHDTRALQAYMGHKNIQHTVRYTELKIIEIEATGVHDPTKISKIAIKQLGSSIDRRAIRPASAQE